MNATILQTCRFYTIIVLLFLTPLLYIEPWIFQIDMADAFTIPKRFLAQVSALALMLSYITELVVYRKVSMRWCRCTGAFALFLAWAAASLSFSPSFHAGVREIIRWSCYGIIFFSAVNELHPSARRESIIPAVIIPASIASLIAVAQYFGADPSLLKGGTQKIYSTVGNPNHLASYLAIVLPLALCGCLSAFPRRKLSTLLLFFSIVGTAALLVTGARGGWAALCGGLVVSMTILRGPVQRSRLLVLLLTIAILIVFLALPSPLNRYDTAALKKFSELAGIPGEGFLRLLQGGSAWRMMVWRTGWRMVEAHPWSGSGIGSFNLLYLDYSAGFLKFPENKGYIPLAEGGIDYAHNDYLQIWIELGLIGLVLLAWFLISLIVNGFRSAKQSRGGNWITGALLAGCVAFILEGTVSFPFHLWSSAVTFFIFAGLVASEGSRERTFRVDQIPFARAAGLLLIAAILFSPVCIWYMCGTVASEVYLSRGIDLFYGGNIARALSEFERATRWQPHNGQARFFLALCLAEKGRYPEAFQELLMASRTFSRQALYVQLGRISGRLGNVAEGRQFLDRAIFMLPRDPDAWLEKGNLLYMSGDIRGASACFQKSVSLKPDYFPAARNLAVSLDALGRSDEAFRAYERALELRPREADLYVNMGALRARMGDAQRARALWREALSIDPTNEMAKENLRRLERGNDDTH